jgi:hypothetical protein
MIQTFRLARNCAISSGRKSDCTAARGRLPRPLQVATICIKARLEAVVVSGPSADPRHRFRRHRFLFLIRFNSSRWIWIRSGALPHGRVEQCAER